MTAPIYPTHNFLTTDYGTAGDNDAQRGATHDGSAAIFFNSRNGWAISRIKVQAIAAANALSSDYIHCGIPDLFCKKGCFSAGFSLITMDEVESDLGAKSLIAEGAPVGIDVRHSAFRSLCGERNKTSLEITMRQLGTVRNLVLQASRLRPTLPVRHNFERVIDHDTHSHAESLWRSFSSSGGCGHGDGDWVCTSAGGDHFE